MVLCCSGGWLLCMLHFLYVLYVTLMHPVSTILQKIPTSCCPKMFLHWKKNNSDIACKGLNIYSRYSTLNPPSMTKVPYAKSLDSKEIQSKSASHPDNKLFDTQTTFHQLWAKLKHFEKLKQTRNVADDNLFGGLRVNTHLQVFCISGI